nr:MAG TPA: Neurohypophysial hormone [Caudoviricetes sp.]DAG08231.1 MAG TPA: neurohypophysial hormone [Caudoviricetes sp.]DAQ06512.1 MAG TPA: Neurohypophysial hormone [Caudoviricetes sp.]
MNGRCFLQNCCVKILTFGFSAHPKASREFTNAHVLSRKQ